MHFRSQTLITFLVRGECNMGSSDPEPKPHFMQAEVSQEKGDSKKRQQTNGPLWTARAEYMRLGDQFLPCNTKTPKRPYIALTTLQYCGTLTILRGLNIWEKGLHLSCFTQGLVLATQHIFPTVRVRKEKNPQLTHRVSRFGFSAYGFPHLQECAMWFT